MTEVWTLTVDKASSRGIVTIVCAAEQKCYDTLRERWDERGEHATLDDGDMLQALIDNDGLEVYIDCHQIDLAPPIHTYVDLSTGHLPQGEMDSISEARPRVLEDEYGAWVNVLPGEFESDDDGEWDNFPELLRVTRWARERGARWICFDRDADIVDGLPTWEW